MEHLWEQLNGVIVLLAGAGYKTVKHIAADATTTNFKSYLNCPKLKCVIHVGHGNNEKGILLADTDIRHEWFAEQPTDYLSQQIHLYGSCLVQNDPFKAAILHTGVEAFMGGITTIDIVTLQNTMYFISMGMFYGKEVEESFLSTDARSHGWGISGNPPSGPWYVDFDATDMSKEVISTPSNSGSAMSCIYNKVTNKILVNLKGGIKKNENVKLDIFSTNGRFIKTAFNGNIPNGDKQILIEGKNLSKGIYILKIKSSNFIESTSLIVN